MITSERLLFSRRVRYAVTRSLACCFAVLVISFGALIPIAAQSNSNLTGQDPDKTAARPSISSQPLNAPVASGNRATDYFDPVQGASSSDLVRRALASNGELAAI